MIIDCISDLHGTQPALPGGDILIVAGDCTARDEFNQWGKFAKYLGNAKYNTIILVAGNHDGFLEDPSGKNIVLQMMPPNVLYLEDQVGFIQGLKVYGSPWTPMFCNWSFMLDRGEQIRKRWELIPEGLDILITHGPPMGILDDNNESGMDRPGCKDLHEIVEQRKPKYHVFGHIHECHGQYAVGDNGTTFINAAMVDVNYRPITHKPIRVVI